MNQDRYDREALRRAWAEQGFTCEVWIDPPNQVWHDFQHDVDELVLLMEGEAMIEMQGKTVRLSAGDQLTIAAGTRHTVHNTGTGPAKWLHGYRTAAQNADARQE